MTGGAMHFFERTRNAKKIMVLDLGFLGDTIHLLPALRMVRQACPQAELHVAVASHITSLMDCVPWVDRVWGYMRYPRHATLRENLNVVRRLRREKFDAVINLNGSDRSSWLTFLSGARERLGRLPEDGGPLFWKHLFTAHVDYPFGAEPVYLQRCRCLQKAGFPFTQPEFHVEIAPENLRAADMSGADKGTFFHISPFTTADYKELAPEQMGIDCRARQKISEKKTRTVMLADAARTGEDGKAGGAAAAKTLARVRRQPHFDAGGRRHQAQRFAFVRRRRHAAPGPDDAGAGCFVVLAQPRLA